MEKEILQKWIRSKDNIYVWGGSTASLNMVYDLLKVYNNLNFKGVIDNFIEDKYLLVENRKKQVYRFDEIEKEAKIILCITKRSSYVEIRKQLVLSDKQYGIDYIEVQPLINVGYNDTDMNIGSHENPYENFGIGTRYAPWRKNGSFQDVFNRCRNNTLVDVYRCYELWSLVQESSKCLDGDLLEIGVWRGGSGALICKAAEEAKISNKVYLCDTFRGVVKCTEHDHYYKGSEHSDTSMEIVMDLIEHLNICNVEVCQGIFPDDMIEVFRTKKYRFVHIDVDTYQSAKDIFEFVWENVVVGGIVVFDDYGFETTNGVTELLDTIEMLIEDGIFCVNMNGHGYFVKVR